MYDYRKAMKEDILSYIEENGVDLSLSFEELYEQLYEEMWDNNDITGNGSRLGYTMGDEDEAWSYVAENRELLIEAADDFEADCRQFFKEPIEADATIRCYLLDLILEEVIDALKGE